MAGGIFISYRREDSAAAAGRIFDHLVSRFGRDLVFMDVDALEPGVDFVEELNRRVGGCDALIAVIGRDWLEARDAKGRRRIDLDHDFVQIEIAAALQRNVRVIPVLVDDADMPAADQLPDPLKTLARRNAFPVSHARFATDIQTLSDSLQRVVGAAPAAPAPARPAAAAAAHAPAGRTEAILAAIRPYHDGETIFAAPDIPANREANARAACGAASEEAVLLFIDFTVMRNGRDALVLTDRALRVHHSQATPRIVNIDLETLRASDVQKTGWWSLQVGATPVNTAGGPAVAGIIAVLNAARAALAGRAP